MVSVTLTGLRLATSAADTATVAGAAAGLENEFISSIRVGLVTGLLPLHHGEIAGFQVGQHKSAAWPSHHPHASVRLKGTILNILFPIHENIANRPFGLAS